MKDLKCSYLKIIYNKRGSPSKIKNMCEENSDVIFDGQSLCRRHQLMKMGLRKLLKK